MEGLITELYEIIKDYRKEEGFMSPTRIENWINQFDEGDREFVLSETIHIMRKRYISQEAGRIHVKEMIDWLIKTYKHNSAKDFIQNAFFIDNQDEGKSQKLFLTFFDEILKKDYNTSLQDCNSDTPKYVIYLDDILCTGETVMKSFVNKEQGWFVLPHSTGKSNREYCLENKVELILAYFAIHDKGTNKLEQRMYRALGNKPVPQIKFVRQNDFEIENDLSRTNSKLNFIYPSKNIMDNTMENCRKQIEEKIRKDAGSKGFETTGGIKYRDPKDPANEVLFSTSQGRDKYEKIILQKCIEIYNSSSGLQEHVRPRPLGYGLYHEYTFGFGTLVFTWRNTPFNTPLIFWYPYNNWTPLFERKFT